MTNKRNGPSTKREPFSGINVIDMGVGGVDPLAASMLGFLGANVVKVEAPFREMLFSQIPQQKGVGFAWLNSNLNKRSVILDLREADDLKRFQTLVREADIVMENQKPGSLAKFGVTIEELKKLNPNIILMSCPGWGNFGPMRAWPCFAPYAEAHGSAGGLSGPEGERPELIRYPYHDANASSYINASVLLALMARARTGQAQEIHLSQLATSMAVTISRAAEYLVTGQDPVPLGSASASTAPHQAFLCQDNRWLAVGVETQTQWVSLCEAIGTSNLLNDTRFITNTDRVANRKPLAEILAHLFASKPSRWWQIKLDKAKVPNSLFIHPDDTPSHLQYTENALFTYLEFPKQGPSMVATFPWRFDKINPYITHAPLPGDHTEEVVAGGFGNKPFDATPNVDNLLNAGDPPLKGYKVVELSQGLSGPYTSLLLADAGAEVTKIEPPEGDYSREFAPQHRSGVGAVFMILNRNKKLMKIDLKSEAGKADLANILSQADILIYDWTPTIEKDLRIDRTTLEKLNPRLISCGISPFGENGPMREQPGSELTVQAASGITNFHGRIGEPPVRIGVDMANISTSVYAFQAILVSLFQRLFSEEGQRIHMSQLGVLNFMLTYHYSAVFDPDEWIGGYCEAFTSPPNWGYHTKDGDVYPGLQWTTEEQFAEMCRDLGMEEVLEKDIRFQNMSQQPGGIRRAFRTDLRDVWEKYFPLKTVSELIEIVVSKGGLVPVVNTIRQAVEDTQCQMQDMHVSADTAWGQVTFYYPPYHGSWTNPEPVPPTI